MTDASLNRRYQLALLEADRAWEAYEDAERDLQLTREWLDYSCAISDADAVFRHARALNAWHAHTHRLWIEAARLERILSEYDREAATFAALAHRYEQAVAVGDYVGRSEWGLKLLMQEPRHDAALARVLSGAREEIVPRRKAAPAWWRHPLAWGTAGVLFFTARDFLFAILPFALLIWAFCEVAYRLDRRDLAPSPQWEART